MTSSKLILPVALSVFLAGGALATQAIAGPHYDHGGRHEMMYGGGQGMGDCPMMRGGYGHGGMGNHMNMTPEQSKKMQDVMQEADAKLNPMRDQLFIKHQELSALQNSANPDVKAVSQKAAEVNALRDQMRKERVALGDRIDKELGLEPGTHHFGRGYGGGYGGGYGHRGGYGGGHRGY